MTLAAHVAAHPDHLVAMLADRLAVPGDDPFATELVAVPTRGIERWLTQRLAVELATRGAGDGICANVAFPSPRRLVGDAMLAVPAIAASVAAWDDAALTAHLLAAIDDHRAEAWLRVLDRHLDEPGSGNRWAAAAKISRLFTAYGRRRPDMITSWAAGAETGPTGGPLDEGDVWQPRLWRAVRDRIAEPALPEILPAGLEPLADGTVALDLPSRIAAYGLTALDPLDLDVLAALAGARQVDLYLLHPSPDLWRRVAELGPAGRPAAARAADPTPALARHPLLRSWAQDSRELQLVLAAHGVTGVPAAAAARPATLLGALQDDLLHNRPPSRVPTTGDRSVQIHVCHGPRRQVEVLRDAILHALAADPTLEPRDVVIMTPDLATFAPLLEAAFPASGVPTDRIGVPDLRVRIADRSPAATNPLVRFAGALLDLADGRLEAGVVRELVARPEVQRRFGFDADTAGAVDEVIADARIAWGVDGGHRREWGAGGHEARTWRRGLDRALAGVFYDDSAVRVVRDTVPLGGVEGQEARPVALLATVLDRVQAIRRLLSAPLPRSAWPAAIGASVRALAAPEWAVEWQWDQLDRLLDEAFPSAPGADPALTVAEARRVLARLADDRPSALHFRTGDVTVCTLAPMRSVPYRVVCLLGMDDRRFPRSSRRDGDDLLVADERVGDHDRAAEDRQLLLDAVMAAGDTLIVTYSGNDQLTNDEYPPAVPVSDLEDVVADMLGVDEVGRPTVVRHPLQSFSDRNFTADALGVDGPWGFDPMQLAGARAVHERPTASPPPPPAWPPPAEDDVIPLHRLVRFLENPARAFLSSRLGISVPAVGDLPDDTVPADLPPLQAWAVTDRLLAGIVAGHDLDQLVAHERASDAVPPGSLGVDDLETSTADAVALCEAARARGYDPAAELPVAGLIAAGGRLVEGSVLADAGRGQVCRVTASKVKGKHRLQSYADLLFVTATAPETAWTALLVGRRDNGIRAITLGPVPGATADERRHGALDRLGTLVELYVEGHRTPLPYPCETGYAWQRQLAGDPARAERAARDAFEGTYGDARDAHLTLVNGDVTSFTSLRTTGFEDYCRRLWLPYLVLCREVNA